MKDANQAPELSDSCCDIPESAQQEAFLVRFLRGPAHRSWPEAGLREAGGLGARVPSISLTYTEDPLTQSLLWARSQVDLFLLEKRKGTLGSSVSVHR